MNNMTVVYADAEEKYVKNIILYGKTSDNYLYTDSKCSEANKVDKGTLLNLCKKGVIISYNSTYYMPLFFKEESGGSVSVTFATAVSASASAATTLYSRSIPLTKGGENSKWRSFMDQSAMLLLKKRPQAYGRTVSPSACISANLSEIPADFRQPTNSTTTSTFRMRLVFWPIHLLARIFT